MTAESGTAPEEHPQSAGSARDDELADSLDIEAIGARPDAADPESESTPPTGSGPQSAPFGVSDNGSRPVESAGPAEQSRRKSRRHTGSNRRKAPWWELPLLVAVAIAIAIIVKTFVVQPFYIPSASMENTLYGATHGGDRILVYKPIYAIRDPHPGDIVVFHAPPGWNDEPASTPPSNPVVRTIRGFGQLIGFVPPDGLVLVKRVIAVGGQTVKGVAVDGGAEEKILISNHGPDGPWRTLHEPYVRIDGNDPLANFGPVTVPKNRLWVMGDHRSDSEDSRYHCGPGGTQGPTGPSCNPYTSTVPVHNVIGKAVVIAWPPSRWRTLGTPSTFSHDSGALAGAVPLVAPVALIVPIYARRRRNRRRGRR
jgi:signal peptidase I